MRKLLFLSAALLFSAVSCIEAPEPSIYLDVWAAKFGPEGGTAKIVVNSNTNWTVTCDSSDVIIFPDHGACVDTVWVTAPANPRKTTLSIPVVFSAKGDDAGATIKLSITVTAAPYIDCDRRQVTIPAEGGGTKVNVESNESWFVDNAFDELSVTPDEATFNKGILISADANETGAELRYTIYLRLKTNSDLFVPVEVTRLSK